MDGTIANKPIFGKILVIEKRAPHSKSARFVFVPGRAKDGQISGAQVSVFQETTAGETDTKVGERDPRPTAADVGTATISTADIDEAAVRGTRLGPGVHVLQKTLMVDRLIERNPADHFARGFPEHLVDLKIRELFGRHLPVRAHERCQLVLVAGVELVNGRLVRCRQFLVLVDLADEVIHDGFGLLEVVRAHGTRDRLDTDELVGRFRDDQLFGEEQFFLVPTRWIVQQFAAVAEFVA